VDAVRAARPTVVKVMRTNGTYGSGFVISEDRWVVTNEHVIAKMAEEEIITISFKDGRNFVAKVRKSSSSSLPVHAAEESVGCFCFSFISVFRPHLPPHSFPPSLQVHSVNIHTDVAMLQIETRGIKLPVANIGRSSTLQPGEQVVAIGSPFGYEDTVTQGIVSNLARLMQNKNKGWRRYIQTDAGIFSGNSGELFVDLFTTYFIFIIIYVFILVHIYMTYRRTAGESRR